MKKLRNKLILMCITPLIGLLYFTITGVTEKTAALQKIHNLDRLANVSILISSFIHESQKERGLTAGYIGLTNHREKRLADGKLILQIQKVNASLDLLSDQLKLLQKEDISFFVRDAIDKAFFYLDRLPSKRKLAQANIIHLEEVIGFYSVMNRSLLKVSSSITHMNVSAELNQQSTAFLYFLRAKEAVAIERGILSYAFAAKEFDKGMFGRLQSLVDIQRSYFDSFLNISTEETAKLYTNALKEHSFVEVEKMRKIALRQETRRSLTAKLGLYMGYGGLIHSFKNYLLRGDKENLTSFNLAFERIKNILDHYLSLSWISDADIKQLSEIKKIIIQYRTAIAIVTAMKEAGNPIPKIDETIKIDDRVALVALENLIQGGLKRVDFYIWFQVMTEKINLLRDIDQQLAQQLQEGVTSFYRNALISLIIYLVSGSLIFIIATVLVFYFSRKILKQLGGEPDLIAEIAAKIAERELSVTYQKNGQIQTGVLAIIEQLAALIKERTEGLTNANQQLNLEIEHSKQTTELLRINNMAIDSSIFPIVLAEKMGHITYVNQSFLSLWGYSSIEEILGKHLLHIAYSKAEFIRYARMLNEEKSLRCQALALTKRGVPFDVDVAAKTIFDSDGEIVAIMASFVDITQRVEAERALQSSYENLEKTVENRTLELSKINDQLQMQIHEREMTERENSMLARFPDENPYPVLRIERSGKVLYMNRSATKLPKSWNIKIDESVFDDLKSIVQEVMERGELNESILTNDKEAYRFVVSPLPDVQSAYVYVLDVTARRRYEQQLKTAKDMAEQASRFKSAFLANMSHEIRTPMNAVIGLSHLISQTKLTETQTEYLDSLHSSALLLLRIVNDILDFSKIEADKLELDNMEFSIDELLKNISGVLLYSKVEKNVELLFNISPDLPDILIGDSLRISQVLTNLLNNAIKFTQRGEVELSIEAVPKKDLSPLDSGNKNVSMELRCIVRDTGIGISEEQSSLLFQPFSQADSSTTRKFGGTGLGLTICKRLIELMGGNISVKGMLGTGSTFSFNIMLERPQIPKAGRLDYNFKGHRILIADKNKKASKILKSYLESFECEVIVVKTGEEIIEKLSRKSPNKPIHLVILSLKLATIDGIETAKRIKTNTDFKPPPVFIISPFRNDRILTEDNGTIMDFFLTKPIRREALGKAISSQFRGRPKSESIQRKKNTNQNLDSLHHGIKLLLVEDNAINQLIAKEILKKSGFLISIAENGEEALEILEKESFHGILMDLQMPKLDGFGATKKIRSDKRFQDIPIIAMTAHAFPAERKKCLEVGMNDHVSKPIDPQALIRTIDKWVLPQNKSVDIDRKSKLSDNFSASPLAAIEDNPKLIKSLFKDFEENYSDLNRTFEELIKMGKEEDAQRLIHTLKGVAGNLGFKDLYQISNEFEQMFMKGDINHNQILMDRLSEALEKALKSAKQFQISLIIPEEKNSPIKSASLEKQKQSMQELLKHIDQQSLDVDQFYQKFVALIPEGTFVKELVDLETYIDQFELDSAKKIILKIMTELEES